VKKVLVALLCLGLVGCATLAPYSLLGLNSEKVKTWDDDKIHGTLASVFNSHPDSVFQQGKAILRQEMVNRHPEWRDDIKNNILEGSLSIGMTREQALASWGSPYDINRTVTGNSVNEQWVYGTYGSAYLYFDNDKLTTIQN